jgi:hypothetical protein
LQVPLGNPLIVAMGMGQEELAEPGMVTAGIAEYFKVIVSAIRNSLGSGVKDQVFDDLDVFKIKILLTEINNNPLTNPLYNKITKLIFDKHIKIDAEFLSSVMLNRPALKIVITGTQVIRETDE